MILITYHCYCHYHHHRRRRRRRRHRHRHHHHHHHQATPVWYVSRSFRPRPRPPPPQKHFLLTLKPFELNLTFGQRKYRSGKIYWMTFHDLDRRIKQYWANGTAVPFDPVTDGDRVQTLLLLSLLSSSSSLLKLLSLLLSLLSLLSYHYHHHHYIIVIWLSLQPSLSSLNDIIFNRFLEFEVVSPIRCKKYPDMQIDQHALDTWYWHRSPNVIRIEEWSAAVNNFSKLRFYGL